MREGSPFGKIIGINLLVLLIYSVGIKVLAVLQGDSDPMGFTLLMALAIAAHASIDLLAALVLGIAGRRDAALGFLASAPLVLLVGGGMCFAGANIDVGGTRIR